MMEQHTAHEKESKKYMKLFKLFKRKENLTGNRLNHNPFHPSYESTQVFALHSHPFETCEILLSIPEHETKALCYR